MLKEYDKDNIDPKIIKRLNRYIDAPDFNPDTCRKVSVAATSLCMWVRAMHTYDSVAKNIEPKRASLAAAEAELTDVIADLDQKKAKLKDVEDRLSELKAMYEASLEKKSSLEKDANRTEKQLDRASKLTGGLADEKVRWGKAADNLDMSIGNLVGDVVLCAAYVAYLGPFTSEYRSKLSSEWQQA